MPASLLSHDSAALHRSRELLAEFPEFIDRPGLPQARMLIDYIVGRRGGELDVSGRDTEGTFVSAEAVAEQPQRVIIVDDAQGMQTAVLRRLAEVRVAHDRIDEERAAGAVGDHANVPASASVDTGPGETWAIINAPKATNALAETISTLHSQVTTMIVIGRSDSMSRAVNRELARGYGRVDVSPGVGKHRMIIGSRPLSSPSFATFPKRGVIDHPGVGKLEVRAHGACFSSVSRDEGSSALLDALVSLVPGESGVDTGAASAESAASVRTTPRPEAVLDLGCGNGWLLCAALRATGADTGVGVDVSKAAVASARATAEANGVDVDIRLGDAADESDPGLTDLGEFDLIVLNPPFHQGTAIETDTAEALMRTAARHLVPGGQVLTVFNSHLHYRDRLETIIGPSEQLGRNRKFTVIASRRD